MVLCIHIRMITKTKTVNRLGEKPSFKQVIQRAFLRKLPIEFTSYGGKYPLGWHDRMSNTLVVDNPIKYSDTRKPEENLVKMPEWFFILLCIAGVIIFVLKSLNIIDGNIPL